MDPARAQRLREIFDEAAERPPTERLGYVHAACQDDAALELEVLSLLQSLDAKADALEVDAATWFGQAAGDALGGDRRGASPVAAGGEAGAAVPDLHGVVIDDFRLIRLIGRGGIGTVYEAEQLSLKRTVAIKLLQSWTATRDARRRFVEESVILARLRHPGIAQVIAAGSRQLDLSGPDMVLAAGLFSEAQSLPWIAMELVDGGRTILDACRGQPINTVIEMFAQVADAVHYGHQQGFIHRDLKPANILVNGRGEPKVIDFGIARAVGSDRGTATTHDGAMLGSPRYMSPEQCDGRTSLVDTRSDVYSLGVVLYEAMTGASPYAGGDESVGSYMRRICETPSVDPRKVDRSIPTDAAMVVLKALNKEPGERYQSAAEFAADLRRVIAREPIQARRRSTVYAAGMLMRRRPVMTVLAALAVLGLIAGFAGITLGLSRERVARREADRAAWLANLTAADSSLRVGDGGTAMRRLEAIPPTYRGWEWNFLQAQADTSLQHWDLPEHPGATFISPSGRWAIEHFFDEQAYLYDLGERRIAARLRGLNPTSTTEWSRDETRLCVATAGALVVLDARNGEVIRRIALQASEYPLGTAFSPSGKLLAAGFSEPQGVHVYDLANGAIVFSRASDGWVYRPCFTPEGDTLVWSDSSSLECVDTGSWASVASIPTARVTKVEPGPVDISPDGRTAAVICGTFVQLVDISNKSVRVELRGHAQRVHCVRFDRTGDRIVTTSIDRTVRVWDAASGQLRATLLGHEHPTVQAIFLESPAPDGADVLSGDSASRLRSWNTRANGPVRRADLPHCRDYVSQIHFNPDGTSLRAAGNNCLIDIDLRRNRLPESDRPLGGNVTCIVPGQDLMLRCLGTGRLALDSITSGDTRWSLKTDIPSTLVAAPDGRLFAVTKQGGYLAIIRGADGTELGRIDSHGIPSHLPVFSPSGDQLLVSYGNGVVSLIDTSTCRLIADLAGAGDRGMGTAFAGDGTLIAYCHASDGVTIADAASLKVILQINDIGGYVWSIAISPDRSRLAIGGQDRITHVYGLPGGEELLQLRDHTGSVMSLAWSPDGRVLATGGYDKRVFVYDCKSLPGPAK
ncbi:MAG: WD40 repeat domain-containing serine/threonine-protein kinase [Phycisphaerales bacterium]